MFFAENLKRQVYVAPRNVESGDGIARYDTPVLYNVSCFVVLPTSAGADLKVVGTSYSGFLQLCGDNEYLKNISLLDKVYVDNPIPQQADPLARDADYVVRRIDKSAVCTTVVIELIQRDDLYAQ